MLTSNRLDRLNAHLAATRATYEFMGVEDAASEADIAEIEADIAAEVEALQAYDRTERAERYENARWRSNPNR